MREIGRVNRVAVLSGAETRQILRIEAGAVNDRENDK